MTNNAERELLPCPWCGNAMGEAHISHGSTFRWRKVNGCCADGPEVRHDTLAKDQSEAEIDSRKRAVEAWNTRAQASGVPGEAALIEARKQLINTPELKNFSDGVTLEALHQRERWGNSHDVGKTPADWFWLVGYLAGKALHAQTSGNKEKALHHTISTAAALANWHASISGDHTAMRLGIDPKEHPILSAAPTPPKSASVPVERLEELIESWKLSAATYMDDSGDPYNICVDQLAELIAEYKS